MKTFLKTFVVSMILFSSSFAEIGFSGDVTGVSSYVWRGVKQFNGVAMQGTVAGGNDLITVGVWYSSVDFGPETPEMEIDPFISVDFSFGDLAASVGATAYTYDLETFNDDADFEFELFGSLGLGMFGVSAFYVPNQSSLENDIVDSAYWVEASATTAVKSIDLGATFGYGTYSSRWLATPKSDAVSNLVLSAGKAFTESASISWNYSIGLDSDLDDLFWLTTSLSF